MKTQILAVMILCFGASTGRSQTFEVTGRLEYSSPRFERFRQAFDFCVSVAEERWNIRLKQVEFRAEDENFKPVRPDYIEAGSDETNFFAVRSIESSAPERAREGAVNPRAFGVQGPGVVPFASGSPQGSVEHLWWMFASHRHLKKNDGGRIIDPSSARPMKKAGGVEVTNDFRVPAKWVLGSAAPGLPEWLVAGNDNAAATNFLLRVTAFENLGAMRLPKRGELEINSWPGNGTGMVAMLRGVVNAREFRTNVSVSAFVPRLPKGSMVTDYTGLSAKAEAARGAMPRELLRDEWYGTARTRE